MIRAFDHTADLPGAAIKSGGWSLPSPCVVVVSDPASGRELALRAMGFGAVVAPDHPLAGCDRPATTDFAELVALARKGAPIVVNAAVVEHGPTLGQRINEALAGEQHDPRLAPRTEWFKPWTWHAWVWSLWLGIAMICAGIGAAAITIGPVLLGYDNEFLGVTTAGLDTINTRLVPFLQHDRITMAGCMCAIGANDIGFALAQRRGWPWARTGFLLAGAIGFPTFFLFLGYRFFDPLHLAVAVGFFPLYLLGGWGRRSPETWTAPHRVDERARRRAAYGQLLMVLVAVGVFLSGLVIMTVGLTDVLIPSDLDYLGGSQHEFEHALDGRLLRFVAHDRAGFGGALASLGLGILCMSLWGWRPGSGATWWTTAIASAAGFGAAFAVHLLVGYTDVWHLTPVYLGVALVGMALWLSRESLCGAQREGDASTLA